MKIAIIGAGISGLAAARLLKSEHEVHVFEQASEPGGIVKTRIHCGVPFHLTGGHCFNSKNKDVLDFVFDRVIDKSAWHKVRRRSKISVQGMDLEYPIEFSVAKIARTRPDLAENIIRDYLNAPGGGRDLESWFRRNFGDALSELYFIPYNEKIWGRHPSQMSSNWVVDKLPRPNKAAFVRALVGTETDEMPHAEFYYLNENNQAVFVEALAQGVPVNYCCPVESLEKVGRTWVVNGVGGFDAVISTAPLNLLPGLLRSCPSSISEAASSLKYNRITTAFWKTEDVSETWTYYPDRDVPFHRSIHIGNFLAPRNPGFSITETVGEVSDGSLRSWEGRFGNLVSLVDFHVSDHAYVVFDERYESSVRLITEYMESQGVFPLGRFGEWKYYNMDVCIESAMRLVERRFHGAIE